MTTPAQPNTPNSGGPGNAVPPGSETVPPDGQSSGAIRALRLLLLGSILVPLLLGIVAGYYSYRAEYQRASAALAEADAVAAENTTKVLDTHVLVAERIDDLLAGLSDNQIRAQEQRLHDRIAEQIKGLPQVAAAWVIDADGRELVSARVYPVNRDLEQSDREDFRALRDSHLNSIVWALRARSLQGGEYQPYFTVSQARRDPDGSFRGITVVAVSGAYFASFYNSLLGGSAQYAASVLRDDGTLLARYPEGASLPLAGSEGDLLAKALADKSTSGVLGADWLFRFDGSVVAYRRLADYPVYVAVGRTRASIVGEWLGSVIGYGVIGVAAAIGFMVLSLIALRRTQREQLAWAEARNAMAQRAAIEVQLHQAQKMEAVGLLTAGIAHDFNNLLTVVAGNIELLKPALEGLEPRRQRLVAGAVSACEKASALTARLLRFVRSEPVDPRPVDVNEVIASMSDLLWRSLGDHVAAEFKLSHDVGMVLADPNQLESALLNLAVNARDAMGDRGKLTIETANRRIDEAETALRPEITPGDYVAIAIADTGSGMSPEIRDKVFDPFFTTKEAGKGTGLGLSQVYGFVTRSGGYCTIDSEPGRGTTVTLYLPRHAGVPGGAVPAANIAAERTDPQLRPA